MTDDRKLSLSGRGQLSVGSKGGESAQVRQSFSHGRSKPVVVEHKRRRIVKKGDEASTGSSAEPTAASAFKSDERLSASERAVRAEALKDAVRRAEDERLKAQEDKRGRDADAQLRAEEDAKRRAEENAKKKAEEAQGKPVTAAAPVSEPVSAPASTPAAAPQREGQRPPQRDGQRPQQREGQGPARDNDRPAQARDHARPQQRDNTRPAPRDAARPAGRVDDDRSKSSFKPKPMSSDDVPSDLALKPDTAGRRKDKDKDSKDKEKVKKEVTRREDDHRRGGKLTVSAALSGGGERQRSLAAFRRAQAKKKAIAMGGYGAQEKQVRDVVVPEEITVQELANRMAEKATAVIKVLMGMGVMATINESIDADTAELVVAEFGHKLKRVSEADVEEGIVGEADAPADMRSRAPVVTIMGHVDHGKTSLLDALRATDVVAGEAGGITQHIGAYQVTLESGAKITFLDTPGHEAFSQMRARGASVTDIVVLVVAADDGLMPQTIEAINHAKAANVPMIVAINKMDKPGADADRIRQGLLQHSVVVEAYSGDVMDVEVSAKKGTNLDKLEEAILLLAEMQDLKANPARSAEGAVVESQLDKGRGPVATVLIQRGTLRIGDIFVAGAEWGKVRALVDDHGRQITEALPGQPVVVLGLNGAPSAGDHFSVVESEQRAREVTEYRQAVIKKKRVTRPANTIEDMFAQLQEKQTDVYSIVLKSDVQGSTEAITTALAKIGNEEVQCRVIHGAAGAITESDVALAKASNSPIFGFNVRANKQAKEMAERDGVNIIYYSIIYDLIDYVKNVMEGKLSPHVRENVIGMAEVRDVFKAGKDGKAAGCLVTEGVVRSNHKARLVRDDVVVFEGGILGLRRFKDEVKEVKSGTECGMTFEGFTDIRPGDMMEVYELIESKRTL